MKKLIAATVIMTMFVTSILSAAELSLLVFPIASMADRESEAGVFEDLLRVDLINSNQVRLLDRQLVEQTMVDLGMFDSSPSAEDTSFLETARALHADLYLRGNLGTIGSIPTITLELGVTGRGVPIYTRSYALSDGPKKAARLLSKEIRDAIHISQGVRLEDVRMLAEMGEFGEAARLLERYTLLHEADGSMNGLDEMIQAGLGKEAYREAEEFRALYLFEDALVSINRAIMFEPENGLYLETASAIQQDAARFEQEETDSIIDAVQKLVDERRFEVARGLIEVLYKRDSEDQRITALMESIRRGLREEDFADKASIAYFNQDYTEARLQLREAIELNPSNPEYGQFMERIEEREKAMEESRLRWRAYRGEVTSFDTVELFLDKKRLRPKPEIDMAIGGWSWRVKDTLTDDSFSVSGIDGGYEWKMLLPYLASTGFADPYLSWGFGSLWGTGTEEQEGAADPSGFRDLEARRIILGQVYGSGALEVVLFSFLLRAGVEAGGGVIYDHMTIRQPALDSESADVEFSFLPYAGLSFSAGWMVNEEFRIGIGWKGQAALSFPDYGKEKIRFSFLTLGASLSL